MIDKRFLGEWISERTRDRLCFFCSGVTVVGKVYYLSELGGLPFDSRKWNTQEEMNAEEPISFLHLVNDQNEIQRFIYQFKNDNSEIQLLDMDTLKLYNVLHNIS